MERRSLQAIAAFFILSSCNSTPYLPDGSFAGCYLADGAQSLRLAPNGVIFADGSQVGRYKVLAPVDGKHGPLVEATGLNVRSADGRVEFVPGTGGFLWAVTDNGLNVLFAPDGEVQFAKSPVAGCT